MREDTLPGTPVGAPQEDGSERGRVSRSNHPRNQPRETLPGERSPGPPSTIQSTLSQSRRQLSPLSGETRDFQGNESATYSDG